MDEEYQIKVLKISDVGYLPKRIFKNKKATIYGIICNYTATNEYNYTTINEIPIRNSEDYNPYNFKQLCYLFDDLSENYQEIYKDKTINITTKEAYPRQFEDTNFLEMLGFRRNNNIRKKIRKG